MNLKAKIWIICVPPTMEVRISSSDHCKVHLCSPPRLAHLCSPVCCSAVWCWLYNPPPALRLSPSNIWSQSCLVSQFSSIMEETILENKHFLHGKLLMFLLVLLVSISMLCLQPYKATFCFRLLKNEASFWRCYTFQSVELYEEIFSGGTKVGWETETCSGDASQWCTLDQEDIGPAPEADWHPHSSLLFRAVLVDAG